MRVLGINAAFHDPAAALVVDGDVVAAAEEERFSRRKHGKRPVPFSAWEMPEEAARWCLEHAGLRADELDAVAYSYEPTLAAEPGGVGADPWEDLRTLYTERAGYFLSTALPGLPREIVRHVPHHVAHAASAYLASPFAERCSVLTLDGRGERATHLAGRVRDGRLEILASQQLPHSLGLVYEELTEHLGFRRSCDEYKVMALASYGEPRWIDAARELLVASGDGGFTAHVDVDLDRFVRPRRGGAELERGHADLAATFQTRLEELLIDLAGWLHDQTGDAALTLAGGVALNCVANSRLWRDGSFDDVWVQPAANDAGTALGAALYLAREAGDTITPMTTAALGREFDAAAERWLTDAGVDFDRPSDIAAATADALADDQVVGWFQGRAEFGPRALGHRSLLMDPRHAGNRDRLNAIKGREEFRPVAPLVHGTRAEEIFTGGPVPSPHMLFTHTVRSTWQHRIPAALHVDKTARIQTVDAASEPLVARLLSAFEARTGVPVVINTSLNTGGRPIVDTPRDALECFGSSPIDALAIGGCLVTRAGARR